MQEKTLSILKNPYQEEKLLLQETRGNQFVLVGIESGDVFIIREGIPVLLDKGHLDHSGRHAMKIYDGWAFCYDAIVRFGSQVHIGSEEQIREEIIRNLPTKTGQRLLETAAGTARNRLFIPEDVDYYGVDVSLSMLKQARKNLGMAGLEGQLFQADGSYLPFFGNVFDTVLQMGGLQFFGNPFKGITEMTRVLRPGGNLWLLDQVNKLPNVLKRLGSPVMAGKGPQVFLETLKDNLPMDVEEVHLELLSSGEFYHLSLRKSH